MSRDGVSVTTHSDQQQAPQNHESRCIAYLH